jgi:hypothetical protein
VHSSRHVQLVMMQQQLYRAASKPPQCCWARLAVRIVLDFSRSSAFSECSNLVSKSNFSGRPQPLDLHHAPAPLPVAGAAPHDAGGYVRVRCAQRQQRVVRHEPRPHLQHFGTTQLELGLDRAHAYVLVTFALAECCCLGPDQRSGMRPWTITLREVSHLGPAEGGQPCQRGVAGI